MASPFELSPLPYDEGALAPAIPARTAQRVPSRHQVTRAVANGGLNLRNVFRLCHSVTTK